MSKILDKANLILSTATALNTEFETILKTEKKSFMTGEDICILDELQMFTKELYQYICDYKKLAYKKAGRKERNDYFSFK